MELARSNADLLEVNKELEAFSYSVSHDLRAPLRSIDGFSHALLEDCSDRLDEIGKDHLYRVRTATQRMGILIDDLLKLSRISRSELHLETVNISTLTHEILASLRSTQPERRIELNIEEALDVQADERLLRIGLENLLNNAWKFTSRCPIADITVGKEGSGGAPVYFVRDDGAGFDPAYADHLFGAFQRLHTEAEFPGTGVGLATVQRIIRRHGGQIWAKGAVNQGATFYFTLNSRSGDRHRGVDDMEEKVILLVEDNRDDEALTKRALKKTNIANRIVVARDGVEAWEYLTNTGVFTDRKESPTAQLVLLDRKLPKLDGLGLLKRIRGDERTRLLPVVILTSSTEEKDRISSYGLGANGYVRKPVDFKQFLDAAVQLGLYWLVLNESPPLRSG